jgi:hypothetical protein
VVESAGSSVAVLSDDSSGISSAALSVHWLQVLVLSLVVLALVE